MQIYCLIVSCVTSPGASLSGPVCKVLHAEIKVSEEAVMLPEEWGPFYRLSSLVPVSVGLQFLFPAWCAGGWFQLPEAVLRLVPHGQLHRHFTCCCFCKASRRICFFFKPLFFLTLNFWYSCAIFPLYYPTQSSFDLLSYCCLLIFALGSHIVS